MAREARKLSKSGNYYVVLKGEELFVTADDKKKFAEILEKNFATGIVHGYELTKSEFRLVVKEGEKGISMTMKPVTTSYARYFNRTHDREGKLFLGRFKSEPLETNEEIEECIRNLKNEAPTSKTQSKKRAAAKESEHQPQEEKHEVIPPKKAEKKKNLPSWLL